ncbi:MAG: nitrogen regulation protein NR(II), partial [Janthinobacterium sp.]
MTLDNHSSRPAHLAGLDLLASAVILLDGDGRISYANAAAENLLESSLKALSRQKLTALFLNPDELAGICAQALEHKFSDLRQDLTLERLGREPLRVHSIISALDAPRDGVLIELRENVQQLKLDREERILDQSQVNKELIRNLAHEIKNPLGGIRGAAQLLSRELPEESLKDYTNVIIEEADRLRNLVDRMLGSNKLPSLAMTNIHEVLERVCSLVEAESQGGITLVRDYDPSLPDVLIDREQMIQAVLNIVRNAMQAISGQNELRLGRISLRTRAMRQFTIGHTRHRLVAKVEII